MVTYVTVALVDITMHGKVLLPVTWRRKTRNGSDNDTLLVVRISNYQNLPLSFPFEL